MVQSQLSASQGNFAEMAVDGYVRVFARLARQEKLISVVVPKDNVNGTREALGQLYQRKGRTEVAQEEKGLRVAVLHDLQCGFQVPDVVMNVTENGDCHATSFRSNLGLSVGKGLRICNPR